MASYKLALLQSRVDDSKAKNLDNAERLVAEAKEKGADVIALPEMFICPYDAKRFPVFAEKADGPSVERLSHIAEKYDIYFIAGSIPELADGGKIYNTSFIFDPHGTIVGRHRKIHLFDIDIKGGIHFKESDSLTAGESATIFDTPWGKIGVAVCFDIRFAELFRLMAKEGAKTVVVPAAFNMTTGPAHWELSFRMRAVDNQLFMAGCAPTRNPELGYVSWANSMIADPWGRVVGKLETEEGILLQEIDHSYADDIRGQLPILSGVKKDGYPVNIY